LLGNLQLLLPPEKAQDAFNLYAETLSDLVFIKLIAWGLYAFILLHAIYALVITLTNWKAGENSKYANDRRSVASNWPSRNMGFLGSLLLVFLIIHMGDYWYQFKFGTLPLDSNGNRTVVICTTTAPKTSSVTR